ncbi:unnamed protein product [Adineta steineri]|uniref:Uncharacterized protein n=1 Tax=Adineta steineri TaxID=433720 RepID=A0A814K5M4_9BILA|nr:unnamed protein product [Adineta steineri]CAF1044858.1 unnamed protein product [Adineta steineri]
MLMNKSKQQIDLNDQRNNDSNFVNMNDLIRNNSNNNGFTTHNGHCTETPNNHQHNGNEPIIIDHDSLTNKTKQNKNVSSI